MSSNPFQSARESLLAIFEETRKKVSLTNNLNLRNHIK